MKNCISACFVWLTFLSYSQQYNFVSYGVKDGLAQSQVTDICQDQLGNLWIGTQAGLSKYNSQVFKSYSIENGLADNSINCVLYDDNQQLWIATSKGISKFKNDHFESFYFQKSTKINDIEVLDGSMFLATNSDLIVFKDGAFSEPIQSDSLVLKIRAIETVNEKLYCATNRGVFILEGKRLIPFKIEGLNDINLSDIKFFNNELYLSSFNMGIVKYTIGNKAIEIYTVQDIPIRSIYVDETGILAASNFGIIEIINGEEMYYTESNGLSINSIKTIEKDIEGNVWIGTYGKGLMKFSGKSLMSYQQTEGLNSDIIMCISQFNNNEFAFGTYDKGLDLYINRDSIINFNNRNGLNHNSVWSSYSDENNGLWVGTNIGVNYIYNHNIIDVSSKSDQIGKIRSIIDNERGGVWFGGKLGLFEFQNDSLYQILNDEYDINKICIYNNRTFLATRNGLYWFKNDVDKTAVTKIELNENSINAICNDKNGSLWIGTSNGIYILDNNFKLDSLLIEDGNFKAKNIMSLISDQNDNIWISTTNGVYLVKSIGDKKEVFHYAVAEGLLDLESNLNSLFEDVDGNIWVGTSSSLFKIDPNLNNELFKFSKPVLSITGVRLFKESFNYSEYTSDSSFQKKGVPVFMTFPHKKNHLTFDFIGINNKNPNEVYYSYRLLGAEDDWSIPTKEKSATYSFISPGVYEFELKSANKNMEWTDPISIKIKVESPFWKKWWFIITGIIIFSSIAYYFLRLRINVIKQKKDNERLISENKLRNLEQQSLNASMNRHFIFNSLNSIQYFINSSDKKSANKYLSNFAQLIRKNLDSSTRKNFLVSLSEEIERIDLYMKLEKMRFSEKFDFELIVQDDIDVEMINVPSMILQPFVENSIIHGVLPNEGKGIIKVIVKEENDSIIFEVEDNGVGIDESLNQKDSFDGDHKSQGMEITANRIELLRKINGDKLMIIGPFQINQDGVSKGTKVIIKLPIY